MHETHLISGAQVSDLSRKRLLFPIFLGDCKTLGSGVTLLRLLGSRQDGWAGVWLFSWPALGSAIDVGAMGDELPGWQSEGAIVWMAAVFCGLLNEGVRIVESAHLLGHIEPTMAHRGHMLLHSLDRPAAFPTADAFTVDEDDHVEEPDHRLEIHH